MQHCYNCGASIPDGEAVRRFVMTGTSSSVGFFGKRLGFVGSKRTGMRTLCRKCAAQIGLGIGTYIFGGLIILVFLRACTTMHDVPRSTIDQAKTTNATTLVAEPAEAARNQAPPEIKRQQPPPPQMSDSKRECIQRAIETNSDMSKCK